MLGEVNLSNVDAEGIADFGGGFVFDDVKMVDGAVGGVDLSFDFGEVEPRTA